MNFSHDSRPVIFDYDTVPRFVDEMLKWRRGSDPEFSVRTFLSQFPECSPTLVTHVARGSRSLTRERVGAFARLLALSAQETKYLDQWVAHNRNPEVNKPVGKKRQVAKPPLQRPQNHLLAYWLNVYVKEACRLIGFRADPAVIHRLIGGIASISQIARSLEMLLRDGFLRRTLDGDVVRHEPLNTTSDGIPDKRLSAFHKQALDIARRGMSLYPFHARRAETFVLAVNDKNLEKLKQIMTECMDQIEQFDQEHASDNERLYQVIMHLTPVGGGVEEMH